LSTIAPATSRWRSSPCEIAGVQRASIEVSEDGLVHSIKVGDAIDLEIEDIVPFGVEPGSRLASRASSTRPPRSSTPPRAKRSHINAFGIEYEGKTGLSNSEFAWAA
jgi:hypothetical protein